MTRSDLRIQSIALRDVVSRHATAPAADAPGPAALAVWEAVVKPRLAPRGAALERLADAGAWVLDDEDRALRLLPERWGETIAALGDLYATLAEAAHIYRGLRFEAPPPKAAKEGPRRGKKPAKKPAGRGGAPVAAAPLDAALTRGVAEDRSALEAALSGIQDLMARMQKAEEDRLRPDCEVCFEGDRVTGDRVRALFQRMRVGRLNAESFTGAPPERYGLLLREGWLAPHAEVLALLGLAPAPPPAPPAPGDPKAQRAPRRGPTRRERPAGGAPPPP